MVSPSEELSHIISAQYHLQTKKTADVLHQVVRYKSPIMAPKPAQSSIVQVEHAISQAASRPLGKFAHRDCVNALRYQLRGPIAQEAHWETSVTVPK